MFGRLVPVLAATLLVAAVMLFPAASAEDVCVGEERGVYAEACADPAGRSVKVCYRAGAESCKGSDDLCVQKVGPVILLLC